MKRSSAPGTVGVAVMAIARLGLGGDWPLEDAKAPGNRTDVRARATLDRLSRRIGNGKWREAGELLGFASTLNVLQKENQDIPSLLHEVCSRESLVAFAEWWLEHPLLLEPDKTVMSSSCGKVFGAFEEGSQWGIWLYFDVSGTSWRMDAREAIFLGNLHRFRKGKSQALGHTFGVTVRLQRRYIPFYFTNLTTEALDTAAWHVRVSDLAPDKALADYDEALAGVPEAMRFNLALLYGAMGLREAAVDAAELVGTREFVTPGEIIALRRALAPKFGFGQGRLNEQEVLKAWTAWAQGERSRGRKALLVGSLVGLAVVAFAILSYVATRFLKRALSRGKKG